MLQKKDRDIPPKSPNDKPPIKEPPTDPKNPNPDKHKEYV